MSLTKFNQPSERVQNSYKKVKFLGKSCQTITVCATRGTPHNPKVVGSNPAPATNSNRDKIKSLISVFFIGLIFGIILSYELIFILINF